MSGEVEKIAARLSEAQREALTRSEEGKIPMWTTPACRCAMQRRGLVVDRMYEETLTPLGLAVRNHLRTHKGDPM